MAIDTRPAQDPAVTGELESRVERVVRWVLTAVSMVLVLGAARLPVWEARLDVLQYPGRPLVLTAYGDRLEGDVEEIKILNHYVGLRVFDMSELDETALWIPLILVGGGAVLLAALFPRPVPGRPRRPRTWVGTLARTALWSIPVGILLDIQLRLYQLGHSMDPGAAFRQEPFTPWVVGRVDVSSNVTTTAWPGNGVIALLVAAFVMTFGISLYRFGRQLLGMDVEAR